VIGFGHEHIDIEVAFPLIRLLRQNVARMRMATLDLSGGGQAHSLRCTFVRFEFWHLLNLPLCFVLRAWHFVQNTKLQVQSSTVFASALPA
jgi:hypothetical protein